MARERLTITPMRPVDISGVLELERNILSAWNEEHIRDELQQPAGFQFVVKSNRNEQVLAVLFGRIVSDEAEILKINVADFKRNRGLGYHLLDFGVKYCSSRGVKNCYLELRQSNKAARRLYEKRGFVATGTREKYYAGPVEDGILMKLKL